MQVTLLGTGCPLLCEARGGAATLVRTEEAAVLIDCGSMATQRLLGAGCPGHLIDALLVTHLHSDHLVDFYQLVVSSWHLGRDRPLKVYAPEPVIQMLRKTMEAWADERALRVKFERRPSAVGLEVEYAPITGGQALEIGELEITCVAVEHAPVTPAFGFIFRANAKSAAVSGDTKVCDALIQAGQGCDLLVHEVYNHTEIAAAPGNRTPEAIAAVMSYHTLDREVGGVATAMNAKALALTHFVPPEFDRAKLLSTVAESFAGPVFIGEDLMTFDLASGDVSHKDFRARLL